MDFLDDEPDEFYGVPLEQFASPYMLNQLEPEDIPYLRTIVMCKLYDLEEDSLGSYEQLTQSILSDYRGTSRVSPKSAPK
jgi:hypothetical protein